MLKPIIKRYDAHPPYLKEYKNVFGRYVLPKQPPLSSYKSGTALWLFITPFLVLYISSTYLAQLYSPEMFLGWMGHLACFVVLGIILYDLCPPHWTETVEINQKGVYFSYMMSAHQRHTFVPINQYRGIIPIIHRSMNENGRPYTEYGVALKHPDPSKTVLLMLSPLPHETAVEHYANLLGVHALNDAHFTLELKS